MHFRVVTLLTLLSAALFLSADGRPPKCCMAVSKRIPRYLLKKVVSFEEQSSTGMCDIDALILYTHNKTFTRICAHPKVKKDLNRLKKKKPQLFSAKVAVGVGRHG